jgi:hypothetical protein
MSAIKKTDSPLTLVRSLPKDGVATTITVEFVKNDRSPAQGTVTLCLTGDACQLTPDVLSYANTEKYALRHIQKWAQKIAVDFALSLTYKQRQKKYGICIRNKNLRNEIIKSAYDNVELLYVETTGVDFEREGKTHFIDLTDTDWESPTAWPSAYAKPPAPRLCVPKLEQDFLDQLMVEPVPVTSPSKEGATKEVKDNA